MKKVRLILLLFILAIRGYAQDPSLVLDTNRTVTAVIIKLSGSVDDNGQTFEFEKNNHKGSIIFLWREDTGFALFRKFDIKTIRLILNLADSKTMSFKADTNRSKLMDNHSKINLMIVNSISNDELKTLSKHKIINLRLTKYDGTGLDLPPLNDKVRKDIKKLIGYVLEEKKLKKTNTDDTYFN